MKPTIFLVLISFAFQISRAQVRHKIVNGESTIPYLQTQQGITTISRNVEISVEYYGADLTVDDSINFTIVNLTDTSLHTVINNPMQIIPRTRFTIDRQQIIFTLSIQMNAVPNLASRESFDIQIVDTSNNTHSSHHVVINNVPLNQPTATNSVRITHLLGDTISRVPFIKDKEAKVGRQCKLTYSVLGKLSHDSTVTIKFEIPSGSSIKPDLITKAFTISADKTLASGIYIDSVYINFDINAQKDFGEDEYIYLSFEKNDNVRDVICFSRRGLINPNKPFWIEIGANLDLIDGLEANNFFTGVFFYKRDIKKIYGFKKLNNISIFAGTYESKTTSDSSISKSNLSFKYFDRNAINLVRNDSFPIFTDTGSLRYRTVTKNISLFFSPSIRLTNGSANSDGLHIFASLWFEMLWSRKSIVSNGSVLNRKDTLFIPRNQLRGFDGVPVFANRYYDYRSQYLGVGMPIYMKDNDVNLLINPIFGISNQRDISVVQTISTTTEQELFLIPKHIWNPFFITQFRLSEEKYGFAFTGEIRGFILKNSKPQISLALTKKFDLNKFLEFK
jgi:hypothetical protein